MTPPLPVPLAPARPGQSPLFDPARRPAAEAEGGPRRRAPSGGGRVALEPWLAVVWEGLRTAGAAACPVCDGPMARAGEAARCRVCRSELW